MLRTLRDTLVLQHRRSSGDQATHLYHRNHRTPELAFLAVGVSSKRRVGAGSEEHSTLVARWREEAALYRDRGLDQIANLVESLAKELERFDRERQLEALTLEEAASESGYSYSALEKMVRDGRVPNAGSRGRPRIQRQDLPRKPVRRTAVSDVSNLADAILGLPGVADH